VLIYYPEGELSPPDGGVRPFDAEQVERLASLYPKAHWWPFAVHVTWRGYARPTVFVTGGPAHDTADGDERDRLLDHWHALRQKDLDPLHPLLDGTQSASERWSFSIATPFFERYLADAALLLLLLLAVTLSPPFAQEVQHAYAHQDADTLRTMMAQADGRTDSLLVRYRLYPLTEDASVIDNLPDNLDDGTAREYALLSGLWSYRAGEASMLSAMQYGRRSANILERAVEQDPDDPYVLLVEGQSLLFRPAIAGRDVEAAANRFERLASKADTTNGITKMEAQTWQWLALREAGRTDRASELRQQLLSQDPAPLYRQFLEDPPDV
jgi:tetratricopeptide (TPR) repeat protein